MTIADAQFGLAELIRAPDNFVTDYNGTPRPIPLPGVLDEQAGRPGYDPNLIGGLPVPMGARLCIWLPFIWNNSPAGLNDPNDYSYVYKIVFRLRNPRDFRNPAQGNRRKPYHLKDQSPGVADTSGPLPQPRFIIPACMWVVGYQQPEGRVIVNPATGLNASNPAVRTYAEGIMPNSVGLQRAPFAPGAEPAVAVFQQGVLDPGAPSVQNANLPIFHPIFIDACGDDMIILIEKEQPDDIAPVNNWNFAGEDLQLATFFTSSNNSGIYVLSGMMP